MKLMLTNSMKQSIKNDFENERNGKSILCLVAGENNMLSVIDILSRHYIYNRHYRYIDFLPCWRESMFDKGVARVEIAEVMVESDKLNLSEKLIKGLNCDSIIARYNIDHLRVSS